MAANTIVKDIDTILHKAGLSIKDVVKNIMDYTTFCESCKKNSYYYNNCWKCKFCEYYTRNVGEYYMYQDDYYYYSNKGFICKGDKCPYQFCN